MFMCTVTFWSHALLYFPFSAFHCMYHCVMVFVCGWFSYEDVVSSGTIHHRSINMEVVRRGALILFCDYVVCTYMYCTTISIVSICV